MHDNVSLDNQLKVRELITLSLFYCLLLTCSVLLAIPALLRTLATPSRLSVVGLGMLNRLLPTHIAIKYHHFCKHVITHSNPNGFLQTDYCLTIADVFTKSVHDDIFMQL
jgi:hypothetical protein